MPQLQPYLGRRRSSPGQGLRGVLPILWFLGRRRLPPPPEVLFEQDLVDYLATKTGLVVYPGHIPEQAHRPALCFDLTYQDAEYMLSGAAALAESHYLITVASHDYMECGSIAEQLRKSFQGFRGMMGSRKVTATVARNGATDYAEPVDASDQGTHTRSREFLFYYRESIPTF